MVDAIVSITGPQEQAPANGANLWGKVALMGVVVALCVLLGGGQAFSTVFETGQVTITDTVNNATWSTVTLTQPFTRPVIIAGPLSHANNLSLSVRIRNVTATSFEIGMQSPCEDAGGAAGGIVCPPAGGWLPESVHYLAIEEGRWQFPDGRLIEAHLHTTSTVRANFGGSQNLGDTVTYDHTYGAGPVVLHTANTFNDSSWITSSVWGSSRANPPGTVNFRLALEGAEVTNSHGAEAIGWVAVEAGSGSIGGFQYDSGRTSTRSVDRHSDGCFAIGSFGFSAPPNVVSQHNSMNGGNGGWFRQCGAGISSSSIRVHVAEDQVRDTEQTGIPEYGAWFAFEQGGTGVLVGASVTGRVFRDNGVGGGTPNDGVQNGGEPAIAGVAVQLMDGGGGTVYATTVTSGSGDYALNIPGFLPTGTTLRVVESNLGGFVSTGGQAGTTGGTYDRSTDATTFSILAGTSYSGVNFGDVPPNTFTTDGIKAAQPGTEVFYPHRWTGGTGGTVIFSTADVSVPALPWSNLVYRDTNCNGIVDGAEGATPLTAPVAVVGGEQVCVVVSVQVPSQAPSQAQDVITVTAQFTYATMVPLLVTTLTRTDTTTVIFYEGLRLIETVDTAVAIPGDTLIYTITYTNPTIDILNNVVIHNATPSYTTFVSASCGSLGAGLTGCSVTTAPVVGGQGTVEWTLTGSLAPGASGSVMFSVQIEP